MVELVREVVIGGDDSGVVIFIVGVEKGVERVAVRKSGGIEGQMKVRWVRVGVLREMEERVWRI